MTDAMDESDELDAANEAAWQRLERVSGIDRLRWSVPETQLDPEATRMLRTAPAVRAAHDEVMRSVRDATTRARAFVDQTQAGLEDMRRQIEAEGRAGDSAW